MTKNLRRVSSVLCLSASLLAISSVAKADSLTVNQALSSVGLSITLGGFQDDEGNNSNPITGDPYGPGDINPDDNTPVFFVAQTASSIGQGNLGVPPAVLLPGGVVPGTSDGSSAQANGTVDVTPSGFTINASNIGLNDSGLWQPGVLSPADTKGPPSPGQLGIYLDANGLIPTEYAVATINGATFSLATSGPLTLGGGGSFSDAGAQLTLSGATLAGFLAGPLPTAINQTLPATVETVALAGTFTQVGPVETLNIPLNQTLYINASSLLPGIFVETQITGGIVATAVIPEPSTVVLLGIGLAFGLCRFGFRKIRS